MRARSTGKKVDAQVEVSLAEAETRGACLHSYSELVHKDLRRRLKLGQVVEPLPGLYARKEYWDGLNRGQRTMHKIRGLSRLRPGWVFCGPSAAFVLGASVSWSCLEPIEVVSSSGHRSLLGGRVHGRYANDDDAYGVYSDGIWTTSPLRTALDCARRMPFRDAVAVVDSLMVSGRFSKEEFLSYVDGLPGGASAALHGRARWLPLPTCAAAAGESPLLGPPCGNLALLHPSCRFPFVTRLTAASTSSTFYGACRMVGPLPASSTVARSTSIQR